ncbi:unnamed protein product [Amoebophrya sp. A25]|nr:unnamed protein product [Amoebophrya sp. A25]|eukprot:GSA25T00019281001.1
MKRDIKSNGRKVTKEDTSGFLENRIQNDSLSLSSKNMMSSSCSPKVSSANKKNYSEGESLVVEATAKGKSPQDPAQHRPVLIAPVDQDEENVSVFIASGRMDNIRRRDQLGDDGMSTFLPPGAEDEDSEGREDTRKPGGAPARGILKKAGTTSVEEDEHVGIMDNKQEVNLEYLQDEHQKNLPGVVFKDEATSVRVIKSSRGNDPPPVLGMMMPSPILEDEDASSASDLDVDDQEQGNGGAVSNKMRRVSTSTPARRSSSSLEKYTTPNDARRTTRTSVDDEGAHAMPAESPRMMPAEGGDDSGSADDHNLDMNFPPTAAEPAGAGADHEEMATSTPTDEPSGEADNKVELGRGSSAGDPTGSKAADNKVELGRASSADPTGSKVELGKASGFTDMEPQVPQRGDGATELENNEKKREGIHNSTAAADESANEGNENDGSPKERDEEEEEEEEKLDDVEVEAPPDVEVKALPERSSGSTTLGSTPKSPRPVLPAPTATMIRATLPEDEDEDDHTETVQEGAPASSQVEAPVSSSHDPRETVEVNENDFYTSILVGEEDQHQSETRNEAEQVEVEGRTSKEDRRKDDLSSTNSASTDKKSKRITLRLPDTSARTRAQSRRGLGEMKISSKLSFREAAPDLATTLSKREADLSISDVQENELSTNLSATDVPEDVSSKKTKPAAPRKDLSQELSRSHALLPTTNIVDDEQRAVESQEQEKPPPSPSPVDKMKKNNTRAIATFLSDLDVDEDDDDDEGGCTSFQKNRPSHGRGIHDITSSPGDRDLPDAGSYVGKNRNRKGAPVQRDWRVLHKKGSNYVYVHSRLEMVDQEAERDYRSHRLTQLQKEAPDLPIDILENRVNEEMLATAPLPDDYVAFQPYCKSVVPYGMMGGRETQLVLEQVAAREDFEDWKTERDRARNRFERANKGSLYSTSFDFEAYAARLPRGPDFPWERKRFNTTSQHNSRNEFNRDDPPNLNDIRDLIRLGGPAFHLKNSQISGGGSSAHRNIHAEGESTSHRQLSSVSGAPSSFRRNIQAEQGESTSSTSQPSSQQQQVLPRRVRIQQAEGETKADYREHASYIDDEFDARLKDEDLDLILHKQWEIVQAAKHMDPLADPLFDYRHQYYSNDPHRRSNVNDPDRFHHLIRRVVDGKPYKFNTSPVIDYVASQLREEHYGRLRNGGHAFTQRYLRLERMAADNWLNRDRRLRQWRWRKRAFMDRTGTFDDMIQDLKEVDGFEGMTRQSVVLKEEQKERHTDYSAPPEGPNQKQPPVPGNGEYEETRKHKAPMVPGKGITLDEFRKPESRKLDKWAKVYRYIKRHPDMDKKEIMELTKMQQKNAATLTIESPKFAAFNPKMHFYSQPAEGSSSSSDAGEVETIIIRPPEGGRGEEHQDSNSSSPKLFYLQQNDESRSCTAEQQEDKNDEGAASSAEEPSINSALGAAEADPPSSDEDVMTLVPHTHHPRPEGGGKYAHPPPRVSFAAFPVRGTTREGFRASVAASRASGATGGSRSLDLGLANMNALMRDWQMEDEEDDRIRRTKAAALLARLSGGEGEDVYAGHDSGHDHLHDSAVVHAALNKAAPRRVADSGAFSDDDAMDPMTVLKQERELEQMIEKEMEQRTSALLAEQKFGTTGGSSSPRGSMLYKQNQMEHEREEVENMHLPHLSLRHEDARRAVLRKQLGALVNTGSAIATTFPAMHKRVRDYVYHRLYLEDALRRPRLKASVTVNSTKIPPSILFKDGVQTDAFLSDPLDRWKNLDRPQVSVRVFDIRTGKMVLERRGRSDASMKQYRVKAAYELQSLPRKMKDRLNERSATKKSFATSTYTGVRASRGYGGGEPAYIGSGPGHHEAYLSKEKREQRRLENIAYRRETEERNILVIGYEPFLSATAPPEVSKLKNFRRDMLLPLYTTNVYDRIRRQQARAVKLLGNAYDGMELLPRELLHSRADGRSDLRKFEYNWDLNGSHIGAAEPTRQMNADRVWAEQRLSRYDSTPNSKDPRVHFLRHVMAKFQKKSRAVLQPPWDFGYEGGCPHSRTVGIMRNGTSSFPPRMTRAPTGVDLVAHNRTASGAMFGEKHKVQWLARLTRFRETASALEVGSHRLWKRYRVDADANLLKKREQALQHVQAVNRNIMQELMTIAAMKGTSASGSGTPKKEISNIKGGPGAKKTSMKMKKGQHHAHPMAQLYGHDENSAYVDTISHSSSGEHDRSSGVVDHGPMSSVPYNVLASTTPDFNLSYTDGKSAYGIADNSGESSSSSEDDDDDDDGQQEQRPQGDELPQQVVLSPLSGVENSSLPGSPIGGMTMHDELSSVADSDDENHEEANEDHDIEQHLEAGEEDEDTAQRGSHHVTFEGEAPSPPMDIQQGTEMSMTSDNLRLQRQSRLLTAAAQRGTASQRRYTTDNRLSSKMNARQRRLGESMLHFEGLDEVMQDIQLHFLGMDAKGIARGFVRRNAVERKTFTGFRNQAQVQELSDREAAFQHDNPLGGYRRRPRGQGTSTGSNSNKNNNFDASPGSSEGNYISSGLYQPDEDVDAPNYNGGGANNIHVTGKNDRRIPSHSSVGKKSTASNKKSAMSQMGSLFSYPSAYYGDHDLLAGQSGVSTATVLPRSSVAASDLGSVGRGSTTHLEPTGSGKKKRKMDGGTTTGTTSIVSPTLSPAQSPRQENFEDPERCPRTIRGPYAKRKKNTMMNAPSVFLTPEQRRGALADTLHYIRDRNTALAVCQNEIFRLKTYAADTGSQMHEGLIGMLSAVNEIHYNGGGLEGLFTEFNRCNHLATDIVDGPGIYPRPDSKMRNTDLSPAVNDFSERVSTDVLCSPWINTTTGVHVHDMGPGERVHQSGNMLGGAGLPKRGTFRFYEEQQISGSSYLQQAALHQNQIMMSQQSRTNQNLRPGGPPREDRHFNIHAEGEAAHSLSYNGGYGYNKNNYSTSASPLQPSNTFDGPLQGQQVSVVSPGSSKTSSNTSSMLNTNYAAYGASSRPPTNGTRRTTTFEHIEHTHRGDTVNPNFLDKVTWYEDLAMALDEAALYECVLMLTNSDNVERDVNLLSKYVYGEADKVRVANEKRDYMEACRHVRSYEHENDVMRARRMSYMMRKSALIGITPQHSVQATNAEPDHYTSYYTPAGAKPDRIHIVRNGATTAQLSRKSKHMDMLNNIQMNAAGAAQQERAPTITFGGVEFASEQDNIKGPAAGVLPAPQESFFGLGPKDELQQSGQQVVDEATLLLSVNPNGSASGGGQRSMLLSKNPMQASTTEETSSMMPNAKNNSTSSMLNKSSQSAGSVKNVAASSRAGSKKNSSSNSMVLAGSGSSVGGQN